MRVACRNALPSPHPPTLRVGPTLPRFAGEGSSTRPLPLPSQEVWGGVGILAS